LIFTTDTDISGNQLAKPQQVDITWKKGMEFFGDRNEAEFHRDVKLKSGRDSMACDAMTMTFRESPDDVPATTTQPGSEASTRPAGPTEPNRLTFDVRPTGRRHLKRLFGKGNVVVTSESLDEQGRALKRIRFEANNVTYDTEAGEMSVEGPGRMKSEDYTRPSGEETASDWPVQIALAWKDRMLFSRQKNQPRNKEVVLVGNAAMVRVTGAGIVMYEGLPALGELPPGRKTKLHCDKVVAVFAKRKTTTSRPTTAPLHQGSGQVDLGRLRHFTAEGGISLVDDHNRIMGGFLDYNPEIGMLLVRGAENADAIVIFSDADGNPRTVRSPSIKCFLEGKTNRITGVETEKVLGR
ncbi:MAG: hypothetical protein J7M14_02870, partial [Planctomycetes bacterium]|nr:hypothetical protein [Planctomycetota bacterium]